MKFLFTLIVLVFLTHLHGQVKEVMLELSWRDTPIELLIEDQEPLKLPNLEGSVIDENKFLYLNVQDNPTSARFNYMVKSLQTSESTSLDKTLINRYGYDIPVEPRFTVHHVSDRGKQKISIELFPYIKEGSSILRINSISFEVSKSSKSLMKTGIQFAENSVLAPGSGEWFKIRVRENGIYKIDYDFLKSAGVDLSNLSSNSINIYGNGFGLLPEQNNVWRPDDLIKNAIEVVDGGDGVFDEGDYILFYGRGPHKWEDAGSLGFERILNIYSEHSSYFININPAEAPKRIQLAELTEDPVTHTVTDYNSFAIYERELVNLLKGGQRWYGELFDAQLTQTFNFNIPELNTGHSPVVRAFMAAKEGNGSASNNFQVKFNNTVLNSANFGFSGVDSYSRTGLTVAPNQFNPTSASFSLQITFNRQSPSNYAYLDFIEINARSFLRFHGNQFEFRDKNSMGIGNVAAFSVSNFPNQARVWEISELGNPKWVNATLDGTNFSFRVKTDSLRTFIAFRDQNYLIPQFEKKVTHQNLHALPYADYLIVTHPLFRSEAERLAQLHAKSGISSHVVELEHVYNEFSGGTQDPTAIKFFAKMFFDRAAGNVDKMPKYLCLFGDGTYDPLNRVPNNNYMCPVYHTLSSEGYVSTLLSDDYFGFLDDEESFNAADILDIAVGRLVATTRQHATDLVNKIEHYMKNGSSLYSSSGVMCDDDGFISTQGDWRLRYTTIADDEENGYFINNDLEPAYEYVKANHPYMNPNKIYSDAFQQISTAGGQRYPDVNREITSSIESGTLMMCFVGHGGPRGAAQERIITIGQINDWRNIGRLTLFVSATCEFARIDDNEFVSAGEWMALNPLGGAIALMTTSRAVYFSTNSLTTSSFFENVFLRDAQKRPRTFGEIITSTKNETPQSSNNKRSFMLLGDPALKIALPYEVAVLDSVNGIPVTVQNDTLRALSKARMVGHIEDQFGNNLTNFNGILQPSIFDKPRTENTLAQDPTSPYIEFEQQKNVLYRGRVSVKNGKFDFDFIVPRDIDFSFGPGKASFYAFDSNDNSAGGYSKSVIIGGVDTTGLDDNEGPEITLYLNDENFVNGGITNETPIFIAQLFDESGINTVGTGIGHDITLILDENTSNPIVLNEFYEADLDTYQSGSIRYQLEKLEPGIHTLTFKAWDVNNNSSEAKLEFNVQEQREIALNHVLNYPNPFTTNTSFMFEHNQVCAALETQIEIFTVTGRLVKTILMDVKTQGFRVEGIPWDGKDDFGDQLAKGVYVYRVKVRNPDGETAQAMQKLYLLK